MSSSQDISLIGLALCMALLVIPFVTSHFLGLGIIRESLIGVTRMTIQLGLVGLFLQYIFKLDNPFVNILWLLVMIVVATQSLVSSARLSMRFLFAPSFIAIGGMTLFMLIFFNLFVIGLANPFEAKYLIAIGGMILGNAMRGIIVGIGDFYRHTLRDEDKYLARLAAGATSFEALRTTIAAGVRSAVIPTMATMTTMGIVSLPGMMTGQILGGASPLVAIKYQIAIMIAIFVALVASVCLGILMTLGRAFDGYGILRKEIFIK